MAVAEITPAQVGRNYALSRYEQETSIRWSRDPSDPYVYMFSASSVTWRKAERLGLAPTRTKKSYGTETGRWYRVPIARFAWGLKRKGGAGNPEALQKARVARNGVLSQRGNSTQPGLAMPRGLGPVRGQKTTG